MLEAEFARASRRQFRLSDDRQSQRGPHAAAPRNASWKPAESVAASVWAPNAPTLATSIATSAEMPIPLPTRCAVFISAAQQQEAAKDQQVRVLNPGQIGLGEMEARLDRGRRDIDSGGIEQDHELDRREQHQRRPALPCCTVRYARRTTVLSVSVLRVCVLSPVTFPSQIVVRYNHIVRSYN